MNTILTQLPRAQEAYLESTKQWEGVDTNDLLLAIDRVIREGMARGALAGGIGSIPDLKLAEKAAAQIGKLGYWTNVVGSGHAQQGDGTVKPLYLLQVNWGQMPQNTRDEFTV